MIVVAGFLAFGAIMVILNAQRRVYTCDYLTRTLFDCTAHCETIHLAGGTGTSRVGSCLKAYVHYNGSKLAAILSASNGRLAPAPVQLIDICTMKNAR